MFYIPLHYNKGKMSYSIVVVLRSNIKALLTYAIILFIVYYNINVKHFSFRCGSKTGARSGERSTQQRWQLPRGNRKCWTTRRMKMATSSLTARRNTPRNDRIFSESVNLNLYIALKGFTIETDY